MAAWRRLTLLAEDLGSLERYYLADPRQLQQTLGWKPGEDYRRRDLLTLLSNWSGELDRAKKFNPKTDDDGNF